MRKEDRIARAGTLLSIEAGEYSDHHIIGFFVVLKDFKPYRVLEVYLQLNEEQRLDFGFDNDRYLAYLIAQGLLLEVSYGTIHVDNYSSVDEYHFSPAT